MSARAEFTHACAVTDQRVSTVGDPTLSETDEAAVAVESPAPRKRVAHRDEQQEREGRPLVDYFDRMRERGLLD